MLENLDQNKIETPEEKNQKIYEEILSGNFENIGELTDITVKVAKALAKCEGGLYLDGLQTINKEVKEILSKNDNISFPSDISISNESEEAEKSEDKIEIPKENKKSEVLSRYENGNVELEKLPDGIEVNYFESGKIKYEKNPDGSGVGYYENGNIRYKVNSDGSEVYYYENGKISDKKDPDGSMVGYYENGNIRYKVNSDETVVTYHENGNIEREIAADGSEKNYDQRGNLIETPENEKAVEEEKTEPKNETIREEKEKQGEIETLKQKEEDLIKKIDEYKLKIEKLLKLVESLPDEFSIDFIKEKTKVFLESLIEQKQIKEISVPPKIEIQPENKLSLVSTIIAKNPIPFKKDIQIDLKIILENKGNTINVRNFDIIASSLQDQVEEKFCEKIDQIPKLLESFIEEKTGKIIKKIWIEEDKLKVTYKN